MNFRGPKKFFHWLVCATMVFASAQRGRAQEASASQASTQNDTEKNRLLLETVQTLAMQFKILNTKLDTVAAEQTKSAEEAYKLRKELEAANARLAALESRTQIAPTADDPAENVAPAPRAENVPTQPAARRSCPDSPANIPESTSRWPRTCGTSTAWDSSQRFGRPTESFTSCVSKFRIST